MAQTSEQVINLLTEKYMVLIERKRAINKETERLFDLIGEARDAIVNGRSAWIQLHELAAENLVCFHKIERISNQVKRIQNGEDPTYVLVSE